MLADHFYICLTYILLGVILSSKKNKWHFEFTSEWASCLLCNLFHLLLHSFKFRQLNNDSDRIYDRVQLYFTFLLLQHTVYLRHIVLFQTANIDNLMVKIITFWVTAHSWFWSGSLRYQWHCAWLIGADRGTLAMPGLSLSPALIPAGSPLPR